MCRCTLRLHRSGALPPGRAARGRRTNARTAAGRTNPDGTVSFITTVPGMSGVEFVVGGGGAKRTLITRDAQHEYLFAER
jgi:hypothetical protein